MKTYAICYWLAWMAFVVVPTICALFTPRTIATYDIEKQGAANTSLMTIKIADGRASFFEILIFGFMTLIGMTMNVGTWIMSAIIALPIWGAVALYQWVF